MKRHRYFLSYESEDGCGNISVTTKIKISSMKHVRILEEQIEKDYNHENVVINNYIYQGGRR